MRTIKHAAPFTLLTLLPSTLSVNIDFYWQADCTLYGSSCVNMPANICCIAATGGKSDTYSSVQLSNLAGLTDASAHMYSRLTGGSGGDPCEHEIAVQRDTLECAQSLPAGFSGAMVSYGEDGKARSVAMASTGGAGRGKVAAMVADHVFFRHDETLLYMAMDNETRLAAWYDLVSAGAIDNMLGFMLEQHDQKH